MNPIRIRAFEPSDVDAIAEIANCPGVIAGTLQLPWSSREERRERLAKERSPYAHRLVAEVDERVIGMLGLYMAQAARRRHNALIGMMVHDEHQGRGVGSALMTAMIELADNWLGLHRIELHVYPDNGPAIHLYEKFGFVIEGTARDFAFRNGAYVDAYSMARLRTSPITPRPSSARPEDDRSGASPPPSA